MEILRRSRRVPLDPDETARLVRLVEEGEGVRYAVSLLVTDDAEIRRINREALGHDYATDVVTFDLGDGDGDDDVREGEIVVSDEYATTEAAEAGHEPATELLFYVCHGLLHLAGYDDDTPTKRRRMLARQARYLAALGRRVRG
jgi:probable rRNA maturation factor